MTTVYGNLNLAVCTKVDTDLSQAMLAANYKVNDLNADIRNITIKLVNGDIVELDVNDFTIEWKMAVDEYENTVEE